MAQRPMASPLQSNTPEAQRHTAAPKTSGFAIAAFILNLVGIFMPLCIIVGIALGHAARRDIRRHGYTGKGLATAALIIGYVYMVFLVVISIFAGMAVFKAYQDHKKERGGMRHTPVIELVGGAPGLSTCLQNAQKYGLVGDLHGLTKEKPFPLA